MARRSIGRLSTGIDSGSRLRLWQTAQGIAARLDVPLVGVDFSPTQLDQAHRFLGHDRNIELLLSRGERLPFADQSFDMVVTSAVILHNPPAMAERIRREVMRVTRRFAAHNEETGLSYNRYGYDTAQWYRRPGRRSGRVRTDPDGPGPVGFTILRRRDRPLRLIDGVVHTPFTQDD